MLILFTAVFNVFEPIVNKSCSESIELCVVSKQNRIIDYFSDKLLVTGL